MNTVSPESVGLSSARLKRVDQVMQKYVDQGKLPGVLCLVARRGQVAYLSKVGWMNVEAQNPIAFDTLFRIYSMTKPLTSVAVMMLYEEGRLSLNDPVAKYIPEFADLKVFVRETETGVELANLKRPITIHHLLTHTGGLSYGFDSNDAVDRQIQKHVWQRYGDNPEITLEEFVHRIAMCPLRTQPGTEFFYSLSVDVLGYVVQVVSGQPFDVFLQERILEPLGMSDTAFYVPESKLDRFAVNYTPDKEKGLAVFDAPETSRFAKPTRCPAGGMGLVSTLGDYYRFAAMLLNKGELDGQRLLGRKTVELMTSNHLRDGVYRDGNPALGFGLGFGVTLDVERTQTLGSVGAYGWGGAATTRFVIDPQEELVHIEMTQLMNNDSVPVLDEMQVAIYQAIVD
ncbi:MAG TPA: serine hydrolase domain-containing protein [Anaerolineae bacterium]|nr:serine hydrolase domain-containing protein [Anaerolineae bacterium]HQK13498.1 serine hydrolase domain-containing protein [Anaerolineae bacterium]